MYVVVLARGALQPHFEDVAFTQQWCATDLFYTLALAVLASCVVHLAPVVPRKYNRYERWIPYITGNTTKAACQPK